MTQHIDDLFKKSETAKEIELDPQLWSRLERRMDSSPISELKLKRKKRIGSTLRWSQLMVAASFVAVFSLVGTLYMQMSTYTVTDLDAAARPYFTKDDVESLKQYYPTPSRISVRNEDLGEIG